MKENGWVEEEFAKTGTKVEWVLSLGSNKALEFLNGSVVDFGSTAGSAALTDNGDPIEAVYIYQRPEWGRAGDAGGLAETRKVEDLKGRRVAWVPQQPHIFLLRALDRRRMTAQDIKMVLLQHPEHGAFRAGTRRCGARGPGSTPIWRRPNSMTLALPRQHLRFSENVHKAFAAGGCRTRSCGC